MVNKNKLKRLSEENIGSLTTEELVDPQTAARLEELADDATYDSEPGAAWEFYNNLSATYQENITALNQNPKIKQRISNVLSKLLWKSFANINKDKRVALLQKSMVKALKSGVDIELHLKQFLLPFEYRFSPNENDRDKFVKVLEDNKEKLGDKLITLKGEGEVAPAIANWIRDYNTFNAGAVKHGGYEQVNYLNNSQNIRKLSSQEKEILKKVISIYDWLKYPSVYWEEGAAVKSRQTTTEAPETQVKEKSTNTPKTKTSTQTKPPQIQQSVIRRAQPPPQPRKKIPQNKTQPPKMKIDNVPAKQESKTKEYTPIDPSGDITPNAFDLTAVSSGEHQLGDFLERAALRAEAGLDISPEDAEMIIKLIKQRRQRGGNKK